jgi:uncharacterized repeat protein (TIGR03803 family)
MFHVRRPGFLLVMSFLLACGWSIASGQILTPLWQFGSLSNVADGACPYSELLQGRDGNFYGTAGGTAMVNCTVFKITPEGTLTPLWQFGSSVTNVDGHSPLGRLVQGRDGDFYGTTSKGGMNNMGTVFKINSAGTLTTLWQFGSQMDGASPQAGLVQGSDGKFYGTTIGSLWGSQRPNRGTIFQISPSGTFTSLYQFSNDGIAGGLPLGPLVQGSDGSFYGTTSWGGSNSFGTVFKMTLAGTLTTLWQFGSLPNNVDGKQPMTALALGNDGSFFGTTFHGGTNNFGTIFRITSDGSLTPLWQFGSLPRTGSLPTMADGGYPNALIQGSDGNFYGTAQIGGTNVCGTAFRITPAGTLTVLWQFASMPNNADGVGPMAGLVQGSDGSFYGTTAYGGTNGNKGTIFKLTVPLNPPANQVSNVSVAGTNIVLAIPSVAGETYQLQYRADLASGDWSNIVDACVSNSIGSLLTFTNFDGASSMQGFYRFDITP